MSESLCNRIKYVQIPKDVLCQNCSDHYAGSCMMYEAYQQGKADAIDECLKMLDESYKFHASNASYPLYDDYCKGIEDSIMILEKLKEQK